MRRLYGALISAVAWVWCGSLCTWLSLQREHREVGIQQLGVGKIMRETQVLVLCVWYQLILFVGLLSWWYFSTQALTFYVALRVWVQSYYLNCHLAWEKDYFIVCSSNLVLSKKKMVHMGSDFIHTFDHGFLWLCVQGTICKLLPVHS